MREIMTLAWTGYRSADPHRAYEPRAFARWLAAAHHALRRPVLATADELRLIGRD